jgi:4-aminobutyrate aminotransferase-like enzyme
MSNTQTEYLIHTREGPLDPVAAFDRFMVPISLQEPVIVRGEGSWVEDTNGERYLDLVAGPGVLSTGHSDPRSIEAITQAAATLLQSPGKHLTLPALEYAALLAEHAPGNLTRTFFCNSGAEANEGAAKIAKKHQRLRGRGAGMIAFEHSFHGRTTHALALTGAPKYKVGLDAFLTVPGVVHVPYPYPLRCPSDDCTDYTLSAVRDALKLRMQGTGTAVLIEPIAAVGGIIIPPEDFLPGLRELCDQYEILLIFDEVYTGLGRTGALFASNHTGVVPDIMGMAKALGGGLPLGGFMTNDTIAEAFAERREHFTTFGTNSAISCAAGLAAFRILVEEDLSARSLASGERLLARLREAASRVPEVAEVRGKGLLLGIEFADSDRKLTPRPDLASRVQRAAIANHLLVSVCGSYDSIVRLSPPLNITDDEIDHAGDVLATIIESLGASEGK